MWKVARDSSARLFYRGLHFLRLDGSEEHQTYDNLYGYLLQVLNKRESGNDPVSIMHKKNAEIDNLKDKIQNLEYELDEMRKGS